MLDKEIEDLKKEIRTRQGVIDDLTGKLQDSEQQSVQLKSSLAKS